MLLWLLREESSPALLASYSRQTSLRVGWLRLDLRRTAEQPWLSHFTPFAHGCQSWEVAACSDTIDPPACLVGTKFSHPMSLWIETPQVWRGFPSEDRLDGLERPLAEKPGVRIRSTGKHLPVPGEKSEVSLASTEIESSLEQILASGRICLSLSLYQPINKP